MVVSRHLGTIKLGTISPQILRRLRYYNQCGMNLNYLLKKHYAAVFTYLRNSKRDF